MNLIQSNQIEIIAFFYLKFICIIFRLFQLKLLSSHLKIICILFVSSFNVYFICISYPYCLIIMINIFRSVWCSPTKLLNYSNHSLLVKLSLNVICSINFKDSQLTRQEKACLLLGFNNIMCIINRKLEMKKKQEKEKDK